MLNKSICYLLAMFIVSCSTTLPPKDKKIMPPAKAVSKSINHDIAIILPLSGANQHIGKSMLDSGYMALFEAKSTKSILVIDSATDKNTFRKNIEDIIAKGIKTIIGPVFAEDTKIVASMIKGKDISLISFSNDSSLAEKNIYLMGFLPENYVMAANIEAKNHDIKDMYFLLPSGKYGEKIIDIANRLKTNKYGVSIAGSEFYQDKLTEQIEKITHEVSLNNNRKMLVISEKKEKFDIIISYFGQDYLESNNLWVVNLAHFSDQELEKYHLKNLLFVNVDNINSKNFDQMLLKKYKHKPSKLNSLAYDAVILSATIKSNQELTSEAGFTGINGFFKFNKNGLVERK